jgi:hypothetical protein
MATRVHVGMVVTLDLRINWMGQKRAHPIKGDREVEESVGFEQCPKLAEGGFKVDQIKEGVRHQEIILPRVAWEMLAHSNASAVINATSR